MESASYEQTSRPGARAPHVWLPDGRSTLDLFGRGFTLLQQRKKAYPGGLRDGLQSARHQIQKRLRQGDAHRCVSLMPTQLVSKAGFSEANTPVIDQDGRETTRDFHTHIQEGVAREICL